MNVQPLCTSARSVQSQQVVGVGGGELTWLRVLISPGPSSLHMLSTAMKQPALHKRACTFDFLRRDLQGLFSAAPETADRGYAYALGAMLHGLA